MEEIKKVVSKYQRMFLADNDRCPFRSIYGIDGVPNRAFLFAFLGRLELFFDFLTDAGLLPESMKCDVCGSDMKIINRKKAINDQRQWYCGNDTESGRCSGTKSIRHASFFTGSKLPTAAVIYMIYEFFQGSSFRSIHKDIGVFEQAVADWRRYVTDVLIEFLEVLTEKIGGEGKTIDFYENKIGRRKYNRGNFSRGQIVIGGVERGSGHCFMVALPDQSENALVNQIIAWIEPGTTVIADCWSRPKRLSEESFRYLEENHSMTFCRADSESRINIDEAVEDFKNPAWCVFRRVCYFIQADPFLKFLEIVQGIDWTHWHITPGKEAAGSSS